jgi:hypothetical protein
VGLSQESAVAEAFSTQWFERITAAITRQPAELGAMDAVRRAFAELAENHDDDEQIRALATLERVVADPSSVHTPRSRTV